MTGPLVEKTMAGLKTQTRRLMNPQLTSDIVSLEPCLASGVFAPKRTVGFDDAIQCPYGGAGDWLWVREAWNVRGLAWGMKPREAAKIASRDAWVYRAGDKSGWQHGWRPNIHMPRAASRLILELTNVRAERIQAITTADVIAEGIDVPGVNYRVAEDPRVLDAERDTYARDQFARLWDSINAKRLVGGQPITWDMNPWVWVLYFKVV